MNNFTISARPMQQLLFDSSDFSGCFFSSPTQKELLFKSYMDTVSSIVPSSIRESRKSRTGRPEYPLIDILAIWIAKEVFGFDTIASTLDFVKSDSNVRMIAGLGHVPSAAVISRRTGELREAMGIRHISDMLCRDFYKSRLVCNLSIDSTPIEAREMPVFPEKPRMELKKGRKKRGSKEAADLEARRAEDRRIEELEESGPIDEYLSTLNQQCAISGKKNSKGHMQWRIGYKAHLAVDDHGIIVSYAVTGANVHDSRLAIPLLRMADMNCTFLYALMDGGYSSGRIESFVRDSGKVPVIDFKASRNGDKPEMDPAKKYRYRSRTTVERTNSEMKECFLPAKLYSRGKNALLEIELAILLTTIKRMDMVLKEERAARLRKPA
jgi:IS5 family transposase